jgi:hypothetical protein
VEWAKWFWRGAVHIDDVSQAVIKCIELLEKRSIPECPAFAIDGKYDYSKEELENWDALGPGSTFRNRYGEESLKLAIRNGLDPEQKPNILDPEKDIPLPGYVPGYSVADLLEELRILDSASE